LSLGVCVIYLNYSARLSVWQPALRLPKGFVLPVADHTEKLHLAANLYLGLGFSVLPVHGNKSAAIQWKQYQTRRPTSSDLHHWFTQKQYPGLAIITGMISGIIVLDFDDSKLFHQFQTQNPDLVETRTVQTKRGFHLYFSLAPGVRLKSQKAPGVDLQSDGRFVVSPPTIIDGHEYKITKGGQPKILTINDKSRILSFIDSITGMDRPNSDKRRLNGRFNAIKGSFCAALKPKKEANLAPNELINLYRFLAPKNGRNDALFQVSLRARDYGWSAENTISILADIHATQPPNGNHKPETIPRRLIEAERTIQSAFSRPPRQIEQIEKPEQPEVQQLPNTVKEALFQRKQTFVVRVIEGLRLKGIEPRQTFTEAQARQLLQGIVGNYSIREALTATNAKKVHRVSAVGTSNTKKDSSNNAFIDREAKSESIRAGHPIYLYRMPSNEELCAKLDVEPMRTSDPLTEDDLQSAKETRMAAHREFIRRRPGHYPRAFLASRLGVSISTEQRYNQDIPLQVTPTFNVKPIFWWNLNAIPDDLDIPGLFLQNETGKRFPAKQPIARKLLSQGKKVMLVRQGVNFYSFGDQQSTKMPNQHMEQQLPLGCGDFGLGKGGFCPET
jgi:hypothetical protein